jgi:peptide/nickel transport system permease protein
MHSDQRARRLALTVPLLLGICTLSFAIIHVAPGGPSILMVPRLRPADTLLMEHQLGLDAPLWVQYARWLGLLVHGNLGNSLITGGPVASIIASRLPATLELMGAAIGLSLLIGVPIGILAAARQNKPVDRIAATGALFGLSVPQFWVALVVIIVFAVDLHWLPSAGIQTLGAAPSPGDRLRHLILPAGVLSLAYLGQWTLFMRSGMLDVIRQDYMRTAQAKGLSRLRVLLTHGVRNALIPLVTTVGLTLPDLLGGAVVVETIFAWPGMGQLVISAAFQRDYPIIMGTTIIAGVMVILGNLLADITYSVLDPRIRYR